MRSIRKRLLELNREFPTFILIPQIPGQTKLGQHKEFERHSRVLKRKKTSEVETGEETGVETDEKQTTFDQFKKFSHLAEYYKRLEQLRSKQTKQTKQTKSKSKSSTSKTTTPTSKTINQFFEEIGKATEEALVKLNESLKSKSLGESLNESLGGESSEGEGEEEDDILSLSSEIGKRIQQDESAVPTINTVITLFTSQEMTNTMGRSRFVHLKWKCSLLSSLVSLICAHGVKMDITVLQFVRIISLQPAGYFVNKANERVDNDLVNIAIETALEKYKEEYNDNDDNDNDNDNSTSSALLKLRQRQQRQRQQRQKYNRKIHKIAARVGRWTLADHGSYVNEAGDRVDMDLVSGAIKTAVKKYNDDEGEKNDDEEECEEEYNEEDECEEDSTITLLELQQRQTQKYNRKIQKISTQIGKSYLWQLTGQPDWAKIRHLTHEQLAEVLRVGPIFNKKAELILKLLKYHADIGLEHLRGKTIHEIQAELGIEYPDQGKKYPGIGPKSTACALLYELLLPYFAADVNVIKIFGRLGLLGKFRTC